MERMIAKIKIEKHNKENGMREYEGNVEVGDYVFVNFNIESDPFAEQITNVGVEGEYVWGPVYLVTQIKSGVIELAPCKRIQSHGAILNVESMLGSLRKDLQDINVDCKINLVVNENLYLTSHFIDEATSCKISILSINSL